MNEAEIEEGVIIVVIVVVVFRILVLGIKMYQSSSPSRDERNIIWGNCSHRNRRSLCL